MNENRFGLILIQGGFTLNSDFQKMIRAMLFVFFILLSSGCSHKLPYRSVEVDANYIVTNKYTFTKPDTEIDLYRFHWIDWQQLANTKSNADNPPIPVSDRQYRALDDSYTLMIPRLSGEKVFFDGRKYPGDPTARFIMMDENGWVAGIQSTKIREDYPKDDSLLTELVAKKRLAIYGGQLNREGRGRVELKFFYYQNRLVLEDKIFNPTMMLPFFLSSGHGFSNDPGNPVRINRCIVRNGYFIEVSVYTVAKNQSGEKYTEKAAMEISDYILSNILQGKKKSNNDLVVLN